MAFYLLDYLADCGEKGFCFSDQLPRRIGLKSYKLSGGLPLAPDYPVDAFTVQLHLGEDYPGRELPSFVGNCGRMIIVHRDVELTIRELHTGEMEVLPFSLMDQEGALLSQDYVFLNPLVHWDCADREKSDFRYTKKGKLLKITKLVLAAPKLAGAPDIFRLQDKPNVCLFSQRLVDRVQGAGYTNFSFTPVPQG